MSAVRVHLDHNATTPMRPEVREHLVALLDSELGNPSSLHASGRRARHVVDEARERVAAALGIHDDEVLFTGGGTESVNLALAGALAARGAGAGLLTTPIEHSAVLAAMGALADAGHPHAVTTVDARGRLDPELVAELLAAPGADLLAVQTANNEIGVVHPVRDLVALARARGAAASGASGARGPALVFSDAVQALGRVELPLAGPGEDPRTGVDLLALSAHKVGGPAGVGVLVRRRGVELRPLVYGGGHEAGVRPGTENVVGISAAALAIELAVSERAAYAERVHLLARELWTELVGSLPNAKLQGPDLDATDRLPNTLCVTLPGTDGKVLVTQLDLEGLEVSAGSACASGSLEPSHVLLAIGCNERDARASVRVSLGRTTTRAECAHAVHILRKVATRTRAT